MAADRVVLSYVLADEWVASALEEASYRGYLRRTHAGTVAVGEAWEEFVAPGCSSPTDVVLRVERVGGGAEVGDDTVFEFVPGE
jgi:hypothetical protein